MAEATRWHWRYTTANIHFFGIDASIAYPLLLLLLHARLWTLYLALITIVVLYFLNRVGFSPMTSIRYVRCIIAQWLGGGRRPTGDPFQYVKRRHYRI